MSMFLHSQTGHTNEERDSVQKRQVQQTGQQNKESSKELVIAKQDRMQVPAQQVSMLFRIAHTEATEAFILGKYPWVNYYTGHSK